MDIDAFFGQETEPTPAWADDFEYLPGFLDQSDTLQDLLEWETHYISMFGKRHEMPRRIVMYGGAYTYSGIHHPEKAFPDALERIRLQVEARTGRHFNSCLCNLYRDGSDSVSWHSDADYDHGGQAWIASVSLGETRKFKIRHNETRETFDFNLSHGSLLIMKSFAQDNWQHCVPKTKRAMGPRVNLTFRHIKP